MTRPAHPGAVDAVRAAVPDVETLEARLRDVDYLADEGLATSLFLALRLPQPLLLEGRRASARPRPRKRSPRCSTPG